MLKLKRFDEAAWYDYAPGVRFKIKPLSKVDMLHIRVVCKRKIAVTGNGEDRIVDDIDMSLVLFESFKMALVDWEKDIEKDKKTDRKQMIESLYEDGKISHFVLDKAYGANEMEEKALGEELKNSESSQPGSPNSSASE
jgi:hypothetical protein